MKQLKKETKFIVELTEEEIQTTYEALYRVIDQDEAELRGDGLNEFEAKELKQSLKKANKVCEGFRQILNGEDEDED